MHDDADLVATIERLERSAADVTEAVGARSIFADATTIRDRLERYSDLDRRFANVEGAMMRVLFRLNLAESPLIRPKPLTPR